MPSSSLLEAILADRPESKRTIRLMDKVLGEPDVYTYVAIRNNSFWLRYRARRHLKRLLARASFSEQAKDEISNTNMLIRALELRRLTKARELLADQV